MISDPATAWIQPTLLIAGSVLVLQALLSNLRIPRVLLMLAGFFIGLWEIILAVLLGARGFLSLSSLALMLVSGAALLSKPIRNVHWAAILGLGAGLATTYYFQMIIGHTVPTALLLVFLVSSLLVYLFCKFAEDLVDLIGMIFEVRIISFIVGIIDIIWAAITYLR